jgi:hypothetical protein
VAGNLENAHFVVGKLVIKLDSFGALLVSVLPKASECGFLATLHFDFNVSRLEGLKRFNENLAVHDVSGLVEGKLGLDLNPSLWEVASSVAKVEHLIINLGIYP